MDDTAPLPLTLHPGDLVTITTVSNETSTLEHIVVDEAGRVHIPLVGDVEVGGQDLSEAEARLEEATRRFDRFARVSIDVSEAAGHRAVVLGAVTTPGQVPVGPGDRISDLIAGAGGPRTEVTQDGSYVPLADLEGATVYRSGAALPISVARALEGDPRHDVRARPGDRVRVPFAEGSVSVVGSVQGAGTFRLHRGMRLTEALSLAGGPDEQADRNDIRLIRGGPESPDVFRVSLDELSLGQGVDPVLARGDVVVLHESDGVGAGRAMLILGPILAAATAVAVAIILIETR
jgi:polysaccharide export outer membrane protein